MCIIERLKKKREKKGNWVWYNVDLWVAFIYEQIML